MRFLVPLPAHDRPRRLFQLFTGLLLYGFSTGLLVRAELGLDPWDVFHQGLATRMGWSIGTSTILVSGLVLLLWIPLRQKPGLGTVANAMLIGLAMDATLSLLQAPEGYPARGALLGGGIILNGVATGLYIGAGMGPGPRDGLMTGIAARGHSIRVVRTTIEVLVLALGWSLGGSVGIGTVTYALSIGPLVHLFLPRFTVSSAVPATPPEVHGGFP